MRKRLLGYAFWYTGSATASLRCSLLRQPQPAVSDVAKSMAVRHPFHDAAALLFCAREDSGSLNVRTHLAVPDADAFVADPSLLPALLGLAQRDAAATSAAIAAAIGAANDARGALTADSVDFVEMVSQSLAA
jgi:hypothetical protein